MEFGLHWSGDDRILQSPLQSGEQLLNEYIGDTIIRIGNDN